MIAQQNEQPKMLTSFEVADRLEMSIESVRVWVRAGRLKASRIGPRGAIAISEDDFVSFCNKHGGEDAIRDGSRLSGGRRRRAEPMSFRDRKCVHDGDFLGAFCEVMAALEGVGVAK